MDGGVGCGGEGGREKLQRLGTVLLSISQAHVMKGTLGGWVLCGFQPPRPVGEGEEWRKSLCYMSTLYSQVIVFSGVLLLLKADLSGAVFRTCFPKREELFSSC